MADEANSGVKEMAAADNATTATPTDETTTSTDNSNDDELVFDIDELEEDSNGADSDEQDSNEETPDEAESKPTEPEEKSTRADMRKQQLTNEIRDKVAERNALKREIEQLNREKYQLKTSDDLPTVDQLLDTVNPETGDYFTRTEAQLLLLQAERELDKQKEQVDQYSQRVYESSVALMDGAEQVLRDFPMFDSNSDQYDPNLSMAADRLFQKSLIRDPATNRVIGSRISPYELYSTIANAAGAGRTQGEVAGRQAAQKMMSSVDVADSASGSTATEEKDDFLSGLLS